MNPYDPYGGGGYGQPPPPPPYGPPGYPPPQGPYPYPPGMYPPAGMYAQPMNDSEATTIFVLGILGLVACQLLGPIAWVKGHTYRKTAMMMGAPVPGLATAGWILGIISTVILGLSLLWIMFVFVIAAVGG